MTSAIAAFGTLLKKGDGATPENFTTVAEVTNIGGPALSMATVDVTCHTSPGAYAEKIPTIKNAGQVRVDVHFVPAAVTHGGASGLLADYQNRTLRNWQIVWPDAASTTWSFAAYIVAFEPAAPVDGKLAAAVTLDITGQPTLA